MSKRRGFHLPWRSRATIRDEVDEEIAFHLEMRAAELEAEGMAPAAARTLAEREFGDVEAARRALRDDDGRGERGRRRREWWAEIAQDVRFAVRSLRRAPGFAAVAILTLALGIAADVAIFALVDGVLLRRLPYPEPDRLVTVWESMSRGEHAIAAEASRTLRSLDLVQPEVGVGLAGEGTPERLIAARVTPGLFATLGAAPLVGRTLLMGEERPDRARVAVLGYGLWRQRFGGDPEVVGRAVVLDGEPHTVVGVMPPEFRFPSAAVQLWLPLVIDAADPGTMWGSWGGQVVGRLRPGVSAGDAEAELRALSGRMREENPLWTPPADYRAESRVVPLRASITGPVRPLLLVLLAAVAVVLLIACANVANLLLARGVAREREIAVRAALGASRARVVRQLLTESLVLAVAGGAAGVAAAALALPLLVRLLPADTPRLDEVAIDGRILLFAIGAVAVTAVVFGLLPAARAARADLQRTLREATAQGGGGRRRVSSALVVGEIALAVVLVTGAGLLGRSLWNLLQVEPGFRSTGVVSARLSLLPASYEPPGRRVVFHEEVLRRLGDNPGVESAAVASGLPFDQSEGGYALFLEGVTDDPNVLPVFDHRAVSPGFLRTMGIPLRAGRALETADRADAPLVALVDETAAARFWPGLDPVGRRLRYPWRGAPWITVVGVVASVRGNSLDGEAAPTVYVPFAQNPTLDATVIARTAASPDRLAGALRSLVRPVDPAVPVSDVRTLDQMIASSVARPRLAALLLGAFAALALLLGAVGVYGLIAYTVTQRTRELGVRIALGAGRGDVFRLVLRQALALALGGSLLGIAAALAATRSLRGLLFGVGPADPATLLAVPLLLVLVALLASWLPARRATRVDPIRALRAD